jgi:transposase
MDERRALTLRLAEYIEREAFNIFRSFSDIADEVGVSEKSVRDAFTAGAERREKARYISTPEWLAIDEVYLGTGEHCVVSDPLGQRVLELLPDNRQTTLAKWLLQLPDRHHIKLVTMDMWEPYRGAIGRLLSQARIVVDRYHVHNLLNTALKDVLQVIRAGMKPSEQRKYMRDPRLLFKSRFHLSGDEKAPGQKQVVDGWLEEVPDIGRAYRLKEALSDILQLRDRQKAEEALDLWLEQVSDFVTDFRSRHRKNLRAGEPFSNVLITVSRWRAQILNYVDFKDHFKETTKLRVTNAFAEITNKQIKTAYRLGSGYSYEIIRAKVVHGGILVKRRPPHPLDDKPQRTTPSRTTRRGKKKRSRINSDANVLRLEKAREERDETKGLILNPYDSQGWTDRFETTAQLKFGFAPDEQEEHGKRGRRRCGKNPRQQPDTSSHPARYKLKINRDQLKMF